MIQKTSETKRTKKIEFKLKQFNIKIFETLQRINV